MDGPTLVVILSADIPSQPAPNGLFVWLIWPKDGFASTTSATTARRDFLPLRTRSHSSRDKKVPLAPSFADAAALAGAAAVASGRSIAIEAATGGLANGKRR